MTRIPTDKQAPMLRVLASGATVLAPKRSEWRPLLRRGWVEAVSEDKGSRYLPPLEITPDGMRALADWLERNPPEPWTERDRPQQLDELPSITRLKDEKRALKDERDRLASDVGYYRRKLRAVVRSVERECEGVDLA